jgi:hypothetical protein
VWYGPNGRIKRGKDFNESLEGWHEKDFNEEGWHEKDFNEEGGMRRILRNH